MAQIIARLFDNAAVTNAANPSAFGFHHGPIPNNNQNWVPPTTVAALAAGARPTPITPQVNASAPRPGVTLSPINGAVCHILLSPGDGTMCGTSFGDQPSLRRHMREQHLGAVNNPNRRNYTAEELLAGENALKLYVRSGGWRDAVYIREPGRGPSGSLLTKYADACESIAASDPDFAARYGTRFHRITEAALNENVQPIHQPSITIKLSNLPPDIQIFVEHSFAGSEASTTIVLPPARAPGGQDRPPNRPDARNEIRAGPVARRPRRSVNGGRWVVGSRVRRRRRGIVRDSEEDD